MGKENIASASGRDELIENLTEYLGINNISINGKKVFTGKDLLDGYSVEQKGNRVVCYKLHEFPSMEELKQERDLLWVNKTNPERLKELIAKIDFIEYGIQ